MPANTDAADACCSIRRTTGHGCTELQSGPGTHGPQEKGAIDSLAKSTNAGNWTKHDTPSHDVVTGQPCSRIYLGDRQVCIDTTA